MADATLIAHIDTDSPDGDYTYVADSDGGRWWPSAEALAEIRASSDPAAIAIRIATDQPMRGEWHA